MSSLLNKDDSVEMRAWADTVSISNAIGQLFITGIPNDIGAYLKSSLNHELINSLGVGGLIIHNYDLLQRQKGENKQLIRFDTKSFIEHLQRQSTIPLFISLDFEESPNLRTVIDAAGLTPPPPQLTLAITHDSALIRTAGYFVGSQMSSIGANLLFGPVTDLDLGLNRGQTPQLGNRSFGSIRSFSNHAAQLYIQGLDSAGVISISKHYPGCGSSETVDPHRNSSYYKGPINPTIPDRSIVSRSAGIMTSHVCISSLDSSMPATFNKPYISSLLRSDTTIIHEGEEIRGSGVGNKLIITDDLSDMSGVINFAIRNGVIDYPQIAIRAFNAGHDILLFSHIETSTSSRFNRSNHNAFTFNKLREVVDSLKSFINCTPSAEQQFRQSLFRIATTKLSLFRKYAIQSRVSPSVSSWKELHSSQVFAGNSRPKTWEASFLREAYDSSEVEITQNRIPIDFDGGSNIVWFADSALYGYIPTEVIEPQTTTLVFINSKETGVQARSWIAQHKSILDNADLIILTISNRDYAMIYDALSRRYPNIIGLLHTHPQLLTYFSIDSGRGYIFGNLGSSREAYLSDIKVLLGEIRPKSRNALPLFLINRSNAIDTGIQLEPAKTSKDTSLIEFLLAKPFSTYSAALFIAFIASVAALIYVSAIRIRRRMLDKKRSVLAAIALVIFVCISAKLVLGIRISSFAETIASFLAFLAMAIPFLCKDSQAPPAQ